MRVRPHGNTKHANYYWYMIHIIIMPLRKIRKDIRNHQIDMKFKGPYVTPIVRQLLIQKFADFGTNFLSLRQE